MARGAREAILKQARNKGGSGKASWRRGHLSARTEWQTPGVQTALSDRRAVWLLLAQGRLQKRTAQAQWADHFSLGEVAQGGRPQGSEAWQCQTSSSLSNRIQKVPPNHDYGTLGCSWRPWGTEVRALSQGHNRVRGVGFPLAQCPVWACVLGGTCLCVVATGQGRSQTCSRRARPGPAPGAKVPGASLAANFKEAHD